MAAAARPAPARTRSPALRPRTVTNNRRLSDVTFGFWQNIYKGDYGRLAVGAQYEYVKRESYAGVGGAVSTTNSVVFTSLRYYPF
jgi:hypothetical protein